MIGKYLIAGGVVAAFLAGAWSGRMLTIGGQADRIIAAQEQTRLTAENSTRLLEAVRGERDQCRAEVEAANRANATLTRELNTALAEDRQRRDAALAEIRRAAQAAEASGARIEQQTEQARQIIATVSDACVRAGVPADVVGLLNAIAPATAN